MRGCLVWVRACSASESMLGVRVRAESGRNQKIRRVINFHADFDKAEPGLHGAFYFQFILDDGADEHVMRPTPDDGRLLNLIRAADTLYFDTKRRRLMMRGVERGRVTFTPSYGRVGPWESRAGAARRELCAT